MHLSCKKEYVHFILILNPLEILVTPLAVVKRVRQGEHAKSLLKIQIIGLMSCYREAMVRPTTILLPLVI